MSKEPIIYRADNLTVFFVTRTVNVLMICITDPIRLIKGLIAFLDALAKPEND